VSFATAATIVKRAQYNTLLTSSEQLASQVSINPPTVCSRQWQCRAAKPTWAFPWKADESRVALAVKRPHGAELEYDVSAF